jgi:transcriptional regulator with XRE-family HTH domain
MQDIGARLKEIRTRHGLSQRDLAARAGITNGMISLIETNKASPTVASLLKVLDAIPISVVDFFQQESVGERKVFFGVHELTDIGSGDVALKLVGGKKAGGRIEILHETYLPGADTGPEMMSHAGEEGGFVVRGEIEVTIDTQTRVLREGEAYFFNTELAHRFRNRSGSVCEVVSATLHPD